MDDVHGTGNPKVVKKLLIELEGSLDMRKAEIHEVGSTYEFLKRKRVVMPEGVVIMANSKYVDKAADNMGLAKAKSVPTALTESLRPTLEDFDEP